MGLLRFLSSKRSSEKPQNGIKVQAYDATTASLPPLLGAYPVAGNGPTNVFESLQRSHHKMSESNLSLATGSEISAPAPPVPRFREADIERPSSAPNGSSPTPFLSDFGRRDSSRGPQLSFKKLRVGSATSATSGLSGIPKQSKSPAIPFEIEPPFRSTSTPFAHSRNFSTQSNGAFARGFIDLLDAQSEIKPSGFKSRVKASGVRDYGEDVADRNIGENGVDLMSERVQAFYASNSSGAQDRDSSTFVPAAASAHFGDKGQPYKPPRRHDSLDIGARTKSMTAASLGQVSFRANMFSPDENPVSHESAMETAPESARAMRRKSLSGYIPSIPPIATGRHQSHHKLASSTSGSFIDTRHRRRSTHGGEAPFNELGIFTAPSVSQTIETPMSPKTLQKPAHGVKHNYSLLVQQRPQTSGNDHTESYHAARPPSRGGSVANSTFSSPTQKPPSKRYIPLATDASTRHSEWPRNARLDGGRDARGCAGRVEAASIVDPADESSPAPSPHVMRGGHSWRESLDDVSPRSKNHGPPFGKGKLDEIYEDVPMRSSSLRHWSISSATPTMSSTSSFPRPHSRHTTTTSVDLATMSSFINDSKSSLHSGSIDHKSFCTALESALPSPMDSAMPAPGGTFNIDDYLSSDDDIDADSFITTRKRDSARVGGNEEDLLFCDNGFGEGGLQLPGLFDSLSNVPDPNTTSPERPGLGYSPSNIGGLHRRLSLDLRFVAPIWSLDDEDEDDIYDIPMRSDLALGRRGTRRISALGTLHQSIKEEKEDRVDVRTAVRLRKEAKARQRAMGKVNRVQHRSAAGEEADPADSD